MLRLFLSLRTFFQVNLQKHPMGDTPMHLAARKKDANLCKVENVHTTFREDTQTNRMFSRGLINKRVKNFFLCVIKTF